MASVRASLAGLGVEVEDYSVSRRELRVSSTFTRVTTTVVLHGRGATGEGEDVTYTPQDHERFPVGEPLAGAWTLEEYSRALDELDLWPAGEPQMEASTDYRRWAFESAALDLALRQAGASLADVVGRPYRPVRFVVSTRAEIDPYRAIDPELEFKLDVDGHWDNALMQRLAATDRVRVLDLKAYYRGTSVDLAPDPELYRAVAESFPQAVIEDPWLEDGWREPRWLNMKPSRFGTIRGLVECIEACEERSIRMYGGGQFELGPGRRQIQRLAGIFYADGPNDVAPS